MRSMFAKHDRVLCDAYTLTEAGWSEPEKFADFARDTGSQVLLLTRMGESLRWSESEDGAKLATLSLPVKPTLLKGHLENRDMLVQDTGPELPSIHPDGLAGLRVLLVEDNPVNRRFAQVLLQKLGCTVMEARDGREGLKLHADGVFDIVLCDIQMPVMDGYQFAREVRNREQRGATHVPILALTANALKGDREQCLEAGMDDYLPKPVDSQKLQSKIRRLVRPIHIP